MENEKMEEIETELRKTRILDKQHIQFIRYTTELLNEVLKQKKALEIACEQIKMGIGEENKITSGYLWKPEYYLELAGKK